MENLHICVRKDVSADVSAIKNNILAIGHFTLHIDKSKTDWLHRGDVADFARDDWFADDLGDVLVVAKDGSIFLEVDLKAWEDFDRFLFDLWVEAGFDDGVGDGTVHGTGI